MRCFDDCDVYVPLPLSYEEPGQAQDAPMPLNEIMGDVVDVFDVLEPLSIEKGKAVINISGEEYVQRSYTYLTPNGTKVWCPISDNDSRPHVGATYGSWHDVITMYKNYAMNCGFSVRVGQTKRNKDDAIRLFIGNCDSQLFLDRLRDRVQNLPDFYFDFCVVNGELRHAFWADEISKRNYECFGDVLAFDATPCIHRLVWNLYISPATFEERWGELICKFHLGDHVWLSDMYAIRSQWVPAYFRELPLCCLMKTTSRCESSNASFKVNSSGANTLVQFVLCYDTSIESQHYRQRLAEHQTSYRPFQNLTGLEIEKHAFEIYTRSLFLEVQKEIMKETFGFATKVKELKSITLNLDSCDANEKGTNVADIQQLVGLTVEKESVNVDIDCSNPQGIRNKGCGKIHRIKGIVEEAIKKTVKAPRLCRTCKKYVTGHDSRNCKKKGI
ncbi:hypothetical protein E3N88_34874 [Mikania micrantha]|uniref:Uncharacterized protein n=1 Tax=Mikania micrantha TaxID=192012 RepID=A0A5N6LZD9_9ASTR|nr:hypothetical protein E3N88_34874 [Mikania micrantha]